MARIRTHQRCFTDDDLTLRPMTDDDLPLLAVWNADPEVLHFSEGDVDPYTPEETASTYEMLSKSADLYMICVDGQAVGECRLSSVRSPFPSPLDLSTDCRRIDVTIGEKSLWGKKYGSRAIGLLCRFAVENTSCTHLFSGEIFDYNERACKAFENNGFRVWKTYPSDGDDQPGQLIYFKPRLNKIF